MGASEISFTRVP